jgi:hypothetical protein
MEKVFRYISVLLISLSFFGFSSANAGDEVRMVIQRYVPLFSDLFSKEGGAGDFYFRPIIPNKKKSQAIESYGTDIANSNDILVLYDDTVFGGAGRGIIITSTSIYSMSGGAREEIMQKKIALKDIKKISYNCPSGILSMSSIYINDEVFAYDLNGDLDNEKYLQLFTEMLNDIQKALSSPASGIDPAESFRKLKRLHDEGLISDEEYEQKRKEYIENL